MHWGLSRSPWSCHGVFHVAGSSAGLTLAAVFYMGMTDKRVVRVLLILQGLRMNEQHSAVDLVLSVVEAFGVLVWTCLLALQAGAGATRRCASSLFGAMAAGLLLSVPAHVR
jgi:hypothetical protein